MSFKWSYLYYGMWGKWDLQCAHYIYFHWNIINKVSNSNLFILIIKIDLFYGKQSFQKTVELYILKQKQVLVVCTYDTHVRLPPVLTRFVLGIIIASLYVLLCTKITSFIFLTLYMSLLVWLLSYLDSFLHLR